MHENIKLKYYIFEYNITLDYSCTFARTAREKKSVYKTATERERQIKVEEHVPDL